LAFTVYRQNIGVPVAIISDARSGFKAKLFIWSSVGLTSCLDTPLLEIISAVIARISNTASKWNSFIQLWVSVLEVVTDLA